MADFALLCESVVAFAKDSIFTLPAELLSIFLVPKLVTNCFRSLYQTKVQGERTWIGVTKMFSASAKNGPWRHRQGCSSVHMNK